MRYTKKNVVSAFQQLADALGKRIAPNYTNKQIGDWVLDYNPIYGGYVVNEYMNDGGGLNCPLGFRRRPAKEFCESVYFTILCLKEQGALNPVP